MATDLQLATSDSSDTRFASVANQYGVFLNGAPVLEGDSFVGYEFVNESRITMVPLQAGAFTSINKVATPFDVRVRITRGGSVADRAALLSELQTRAASLDLYDIVTPEKTYTSANIVKVAHSHRLDSGATMLVLEIHFLEVRQIASTSFTVAAPSAAAVKPITKAPAGPRNDPTQVGVVQAQPVLPPVQQEAVDALLLLQGP